MAAEKAPAFQFYPKDFLSDGKVAAMTLAERGAYITLLCLCWQERSIPAESSRLARMVGTSPAAFARLWPALEPCFHVSDDDPGRLVHLRLEKERTKQNAYRERQSNAGRASAATRQQPEGNHGSTERQPKVNSPVSDLRTPVEEPPVAPQGGRFTRDEIKHAKTVRDKRLGCIHRPRCVTVALCVEAIVQEIREQRAAS
jgi:uncharacterized protein YdaU (DUF1376 family)